MNAEPDPQLDEQFTSRLLACDEALAAGGAAELPDDPASPELLERLERGLACVQLLQKLRPRHELEGPSNSLTGAISAEPSSHGDLPCPAQIGRFEIRRPLGRGGFGIVYLAYDPVLCREVALKIPRADALVDHECRIRFQREARAAAGLDHPNLVPVHEAGELGPICYIALAYCPGSNLAAWLKQRTAPVPSRQAARLVATLAHAIHYAHLRGIYHRDLKPSNILLSPVPPSEWPASGAPDSDRRSSKGIWQPDPESGFLPRVTDFGLAKLAGGEQGHTRTGAVLGTPSYMAPEQAEGRGGDVGPATDVYSLGAILYEVVTGRPPFWAETTLETLLQVKSVDPVSPGRLRPKLPRDLETICLKCLQKDPRRRYASAEALGDDLGRFLAGVPIRARRSGWPELAIKWAQRRPALAAALTALVLVTALGLGGILRQWEATQQALHDEQSARHQAEIQGERAQKALELSDSTLNHHRVALAYREWFSGNLAHATQLLNECPEELHDWEWRFVHRLCDGPLLAMKGHTSSITSLSFSPDGRWIASCGGLWGTAEKGEVCVFDAATGELRWKGTGHSAPAMGVAFNPEGKKLISSSVAFQGSQCEVLTWDAATGELLAGRRGPGAGAWCVAYSPDGRLAALASCDNRVRVFDRKTGKQLGAHPPFNMMVFKIAFSPDSRLLAAASRDGTARIVEAVSGKPVCPPLLGPTDLRSIAYSPDGRLVATASYDHTVKIWDAATGDCVRTYFGHACGSQSVTFSPDGRWVASGDNGGTIHVWDASSLEVLRTIRGHAGPILSLVFTADGRRLASAGRDGIIRVWDVTRDQEALLLAGPPIGARNVEFSPDGQYLAATGWAHSSGSPFESRVRIWSMAERAEPRFLVGHRKWLCCVAFSPDGKLLASGSDDRTIRVWDLITAQTRFVLDGHRNTVTGVSFSADGKRLASASHDGTIRFWDVATGEQVGPELRHPGKVWDVLFAPDGRSLVTTGSGGTVFVWDPATYQRLGSLPGHTGEVQRVRFTRDGRLMATGGGEGKVYVWDMRAKPPAGEVAVLKYTLHGHVELVTGLAFSPDGRRLACTSQDRMVRIWDMNTGTETISLHGYLGNPNGVAFSSDGRMLVYADHVAIKIWSVEVEFPDTPGQPQRAEREALAWHQEQLEASAWAEPPRWFSVAYHAQRIMEREPANGTLYQYRGLAALARGEWQSALQDLRRSIELGHDNPLVRMELVTLQVHLKDQEAYRRCCRESLARFGNTQNPDLANTIAWTCLLAPDSVTDFGPVVALAELAHKANPANAWMRNTLNTALYRAGRFGEARDQLRAVLGPKEEDGFPEDWLVLAMTEHRLGNEAEARRCLARAVREIEAAHAGKRSPPDFRLISPLRLMQMDFLRREAEELLASKPVPWRPLPLLR